MRLRLEGVSRRTGITEALLAASVLLLALLLAALFAGRVLGLLAAALAGALIVTLSAFAVRHVVAPLRRLLHATEQVTAGDLTVRVQGESAVEVDELAAGFNELVASLELRHAEVESALDAGARALRAAEEEAARQREARRVKDEFVATVSDELHAPLTSMRGFLDLMLAGDSAALTPDQRRFVTATLRNSENLLRVVEDLLLVARIEARDLELELDEVDALDLVAEAVENARAAADEEGVALELNTRGVPTVNGDRRRLAQLLRNLISNAIEVTPRGGRVEVVAEAVGGIVVLTVRDAGAGMTRLRTPVFRTAREQRARVIADGLAIPIAKGIAEAHGGTMSLEAVAESGTTVRVELPAR
jgi:two-component system cell cycle sensor histidine kinase PleC